MSPCWCMTTSWAAGGEAGAGGVHRRDAGRPVAATGRLRAHELAHCRLASHTILAGDDGKVWLLNPSGGEVAAPSWRCGPTWPRPWWWRRWWPARADGSQRDPRAGSGDRGRCGTRCSRWYSPATPEQLRAYPDLLPAVGHDRPGGRWAAAGTSLGTPVPPALAGDRLAAVVALYPAPSSPKRRSVR